MFESGEAAMALAVRGGAAGYAANDRQQVQVGRRHDADDHRRQGQARHPVGGGSVSFTLSPSVVNGSKGGNHTADLPNAESFIKYLFSAAGSKVVRTRSESFRRSHR